MSREHREPTKATAKHLYANAIKCAFPGCGAPLYKNYIDGRPRTLNTRIAHIRARSEGGPRWSDEMSEPENRCAENLLILCIPHADAVDRKELVEEFRFEVLHEWKQEQIALYDNAVRAATGGEVGVQLTDEEAADVIEQSANPSSSSIVIYGDINNGGWGGTAPGSGGGGGGVMAIGGDVFSGVAGHGGDGRPKISNDGRPGEGYGSGGGGGGASWTAPLPRPARKGKEGNGFVEDVQHHADYSAPPPNCAGRCVSDRLAMTALLLDNYASIAGGLAQIDGGAWQNVTVTDDLPVQLQFPVFAVIEAGGVPSGVYTLLFEVIDPSGEVKALSSLALVVDEPAQLVRVPCAFNLTAHVDNFGIWSLVVRSELDELAAIDLMIKPPDPDGG